MTPTDEPVQNDAHPTSKQVADGAYALFKYMSSPEYSWSDQTEYVRDGFRNAATAVIVAALKDA